jgi:hypothetical protein
MHTIKYRLSDERLRPRRTKLEIPGWAGKPEPRADGSREYAWHCVPFSEAAQYGLEVFYPYDNELRVSTEDGRLVFDGDFGPAPDDGRLWPPFRTFGEHFYTYQLLLDLRPRWVSRLRSSLIHAFIRTQPTAFRSRCRRS